MMVFPVFGRGDDVAFPFPHPHKPHPLGNHVLYTHPDYDDLYSACGYCIPLQDGGTHLIDILTSEDESLFKQFITAGVLNNGFEYVRITLNGKLWRVSVTGFKPEADKFSIAVTEIKLPKKGWWIAVHPLSRAGEINKLLAFLRTDPTKDQVNEWYSKTKGGEDLSWISVKNTAATLETILHDQKIEELKEKFPEESDPISKDSSLVNEPQ